MQKHITAVSSTLLWHEKWYIIMYDVTKWRHRITLWSNLLITKRALYFELVINTWAKEKKSFFTKMWRHQLERWRRHLN